MKECAQVGTFTVELLTFVSIYHDFLSIALHCIEVNSNSFVSVFSSFVIISCVVAYVVVVVYFCYYLLTVISDFETT